MSDASPPPVYANNVKLIGYSDQGGRPDGVQVMVHKGYAYVGHHVSQGFTVIDVRDPSKPRPVNFVAAPPNTSNLHLQNHEDLLVIVHVRDNFGAPARAGERNWKPGLGIYDISSPEEPRQIGFLPVEGLGIHRAWYAGGRWAYASVKIDGFTDFILMTVDLADPARPVEAGRFWLPGMNEAAGEEPDWPIPGGHYALHHPIVHGDTAWCSWRDAGLVVVDVADRSAPRLIAHKNWHPPFGGGTHNALPLPDRDLLVVVDEAGRDKLEDGLKFIWTFDIREQSNPVSISTFPTPSDADYGTRGGRFGPHNVHENRPGSFVSSELIFASYQNAGLRVIDISDQFRPKEVGALVPAAFTNVANDQRPVKPGILQSNDVFVDRNGIVYMTDFCTGLNIMEYKG